MVFSAELIKPSPLLHRFTFWQIFCSWYSCCYVQVL